MLNCAGKWRSLKYVCPGAVVSISTEETANEEQDMMESNGRHSSQIYQSPKSPISPRTDGSPSNLYSTRETYLLRPNTSAGTTGMRSRGQNIAIVDSLAPLEARSFVISIRESMQDPIHLVVFGYIEQPPPTRGIPPFSTHCDRGSRRRRRRGRYKGSRGCEGSSS